MRYDTATIATLICGLAMLYGCNARATSRAADRPEVTNLELAERDAIVLHVVFDDILSKEDQESRVMYVSKIAIKRSPDAGALGLRVDHEKLNALTSAQRRGVTEAADDLAARAVKGGALPPMRSASGRIRIYEDAGAATQPTEQNPFGGERAIRVCLPGYSKNGRFAVVNSGLPWTAHGGQATYILERTHRGWKGLLRDFVFYL